MTAPTTTPVMTVATPETAYEGATALVATLRERLHQAARSGRLNDEFANGIANGIVQANSALDPTRRLIWFARAIEAEAAQRRTDPGQDCGNPMGQTNVPSCAETVLLKHEDITAAELIDDLVNGPWPLF